jgi:anhydro-N-acetylmuramic acid kinase
MKYIGLLSGTSMDCIDVGLFDIASVNNIKTICVYQHPLPLQFKQDCLHITTQNNNISLRFLGSLNTYAGKLFAEATNTFIDKFNLNRGTIKGIGFCGQTIWHEPDIDNPFSMQIGDPSTLSVLTKLPVFCNSRQKDLALGGQGAPLAPYFHQAYFKSAIEDRVIINIGGISNISILKKNTNSALGYDCGPGNCLLDQFTKEKFNLDFDRDGAIASQGTVQLDLLAALLADEYLRRLPPKSTGREYFNLQWFNKKLASLDAEYSDVDLLATLLEFTVNIITNELRYMHCENDKIYLCGGGAHNKLLFEKLAAKHCVATTAKLGIEPDWVEAALFAWFAYMTDKKSTNVPCGAIYSTH